MSFNPFFYLKQPTIAYSPITDTSAFPDATVLYTVGNYVQNRVMTAVHVEDGCVFGIDRLMHADYAKSTVTKYFSPEEVSISGVANYITTTDDSIGHDSVRDGDHIYSVTHQFPSVSDPVPPRVNIRRLNIRNGATLLDDILLPRQCANRRLSVFGVLSGYLVFCVYGPFSCYAVPVDRLNRVEPVENIPQLVWLVNGIQDFMQTAPGGQEYLLRGFKRPGETGTPEWMALLSLGGSSGGAFTSVVGAINTARRTVTLRFAPAIKTNVDWWESVTVQSVYNASALGSSGGYPPVVLALDGDGFLTYMCAPKLAAVVDLGTGFSEAFVVPFTAVDAPSGSLGFSDIMAGRHLFLSLTGTDDYTQMTATYYDFVTKETLRYDLSTAGRWGRDIGNYTYAYPCLFHDDAGHLWASLRTTGRYGMLYFGSYQDLGIRSPASVGTASVEWGTAYAKEFRAGDRIIQTHLIKDKTTPDPYDATGMPDGSVLSIVQSQPRIVLPAGFNPVSLPAYDPVLDVGKVLGSEGANYGWVRNPTPLQDWFNGATPVYDGAQQLWRAGDALIDMPRVRRDGVVWVSKDRRWEARVLPFTSGVGANPIEFVKLINTAMYTNTWVCLELAGVAVADIPNPLYATVYSGLGAGAYVCRTLSIMTADGSRSIAINLPDGNVGTRLSIDLVARTATIMTPRPQGYGLGDTFPHVTFDRPCWPMYVSGAYRSWATDAYPPATGRKQGFLWGAPTEYGDALGTLREEIGVCGALNDKWWEGAQDTSNRRFTNFWPVNNTGTGRHEVGDMLYTIRPNLDSYADSWKKMDAFVVPCKTNTWEPGSMYGEEHKELYFMWSRWMARQWMRGAVTYARPIRYECQISDTSDFTNILEEFDTADATDGWQFEHTDGGQSTFLPTGPTANTVKGVVFDPRFAGFPFDRTLHFLRWRRYVNNAATPEADWQPGDMLNIDTSWRVMMPIHDQRFVNHVVIPQLGEPQFSGDASFVSHWLFSKKPSVPIGGHCVFMPPLPGETRPVVVELQVGDGVWFDRSSASSPETDPEAWFTSSNDVVAGYPEDFILPTCDFIMFDPVKSAIESRVGSRFFRYRYVVDGTPGRWFVKETLTSQASQLRTDNLNVVGVGFGRENADTPVRLGRIASTPLTVYTETPDEVLYKKMETANVDLSEVTADNKVLMGDLIPDDAAGRTQILAQGMYDALRDDDRYDVIWQLHNKRRDQLELPPVFEMNLTQVVQSWREPVSARATNNLYMQGDTFQLGGVSRVSMNMCAYDYVPGSTVCSRIAPNFDVDPTFFSFQKANDYGDESKSATEPRTMTGISEDRRFVAATGVVADSGNAGSVYQSYCGFVVDTILGVPRKLEMHISRTPFMLPMCVDGGLFWNPTDTVYPFHNRVYDPRAGLWLRTNELRSWEDDPPTGQHVYAPLEHIRELDATLFCQEYGQQRTYLFRKDSDEFSLTGILTPSVVRLERGSEDAPLGTYCGMPFATTLPRRQRGACRATDYRSGSSGNSPFADTRDYLRWGGDQSYLSAAHTASLLYGSTGGRIRPFPTYSGFYMRVAGTGANEMLQHVRLPGSRVFQCVGSKNTYDRLDSGIIDGMTGGCQPFLPVRDITTTSTYVWGTNLVLGDTTVMSPQNYSSGSLVVGTMVGEAVHTDGMVADGFHTLNLWQNRGR